ncbi:uncharacterized protein [Nicotiana tomentosiformis]|uniref:uncharacterized protein n=1 Tax=Nicotiana tomentosiformis TaxID=4098 RepID=UPI001446FCFD|nr:uncharacterized protein LOC117275419 [Nicotiana tomentosiformis]
MEHTTIDVDKEGLICLACRGNWGFFVEDNLSQCFTWNFKSHAKIQLPPIPNFQYLPKNLLKCVLMRSTTHNTQRLHTSQKRRKNQRLNEYLCNVFVFLKEELYFLVCRSPSYTHWETIKFEKNWTNGGLCDAAHFHNGKSLIFTLSRNGKLGVIEDLPKVRMRAPTSPSLSKAPTDGNAMYRRRQLVPYKNQLFLVQQRLGSPTVMEVWNVDFKTEQFKRMFNLDDILIFLSRGYSSVGRARVQGNCVYFTEYDYHKDKFELYVFDFKDQSIFLSPQDNLRVRTPHNSIPSLLLAISNKQHNAGDKQENELTHVNCAHNAKEQIVQPNICTQLSLDLQRKISLYLFTEDAHSYKNFRSVCKLWRSLAPCLRWKVDTTRSSGSVQDCVWLLTINQEDGLCTLYNPFTNLTCYMNNSDLVGCEIRYSKDGLLLVSKGPRSLFFLEPFTKQIIQLPQRIEDYCSETMSFSVSPCDCSDWIIFGIVCVDEDQVRISYLRAGDDSWTSLTMDNEIPFLLSCSSPVYFGREFCVIGENGGDVGVFGFFEDGNCYWRIQQTAHLYKPRLGAGICRHFLVQSEQNVLYSVIVGGQTQQLVRVYELNFLQNTVKLVKEFKTWLLFISEASSLLMRSTKLGLDDAVLFPNFSSKDDFIHYSLDDATFKAGKDEFNDICHRKELLGRVWIYNKYLIPVLNETDYQVHFSF